MITIAVFDYPEGLSSWESVIQSDSGFFAEKNQPLDFPVQFDAVGKTTLVVGYYDPITNRFLQRVFEFTAQAGDMYKASIKTGELSDFWSNNEEEAPEEEPPASPRRAISKADLAVIIGIPAIALMVKVAKRGKV